MSVATPAQALVRAGELGLERLDAQLLLLHALGRKSSERAWLIAHDTDLLDAAVLAGFLEFCGRRGDGEPLAYIVGTREFFGMELQVDPRVLVPRPETETLVEWALELLAGGLAANRPDAVDQGADRPAVLDLGTGSGAIALAVKQAWPAARVEALDISTAALEVASSNARTSALDVHFRRSCWLAETVGQYDLILANPPYVAQGDRHLEALVHEPLIALTAGADGLDDLRKIIDQAPVHLHDRGWLLLEHGWDQALAVRALLLATGFTAITSRRDLAGVERCSGGQWLELG